MPNLVSLSCLSAQILDKTQAVVFHIYQFLVKSFIIKNCHNSRTSNDIDMEPGTANKLEKRNTTTLEKLVTTSFQQITTSSSFFWLMVDLEQSGTRTPDAWSIIPTFWLLATFCLTKLKTDLKISNTALILLPWIKALFLLKNVFFAKILTSAKLRGLGTKRYILS